MPTFHYKCVLFINITLTNKFVYVCSISSLGSIYTIHIRQCHEYSVQFAKLWFYPIRFEQNVHFTVHCTCMSIHYNLAAQLITHIAATTRAK